MFTAQAMWATSAADEGFAGGAVGRLDGGRLQPVRDALGHPLLEERLAGGAVRVALHEQRAGPASSPIRGSPTAS